LFERWGIADAVAPRIVQAPPGLPVETLVAGGDVELGFQQLSELMHVRGIDVIGVLPPEIQAETVFSAAICTASNRPAAAKALPSFLASPGTAQRRAASVQDHATRRVFHGVGSTVSSPAPSA
jgi:molybdate transport system substrate-binding protein